jgi:DNA repair protein RecN (Recombination protein N)
MLSELYIVNFAIIEELRVQFAFGFNVLTGETGAGKSILLDSLTLLLGGRSDSSMVRAGCDRAILEATFELTTTVQEALAPLLTQESLEAEEPDHIVLGRELKANGRTVCRVNGRTVSLALLRQVGEFLVDIHGQGEHLSLLKPKSHLPLLDSYGRLDNERQVLATEVSQLRKVQAELKNLRDNARSIAQRIDFLQFQVDEIAAADLQEDEEDELKAERTRLANVEQLMKQTNLINAVIEGMGDDSPAILDMIGTIERAMTHLAKLDPDQHDLLEKLQGLSYQFSEFAGEVQDYQDTLEFNPSRLSEVEDRLELINRLKRKYGDDIQTILDTYEKAVAELDTITHSETRIEELMVEEKKRLQQIGDMAQKLSTKRQQAAGKIAKTVEQELGHLRMAGARFSVDFQVEPSENGAYVGERRLAFDQTGIDKAEFLISTNPGEPLKPMAKVASGGETARLMLALKTALAQVDSTPTLIFDEIDQGIGGRIGDTVGQKLWGLTQHGGHQVIVVTHLPQMAGYGDIHLHVRKQVNGGRTTTAVATLDREGRVNELGAMLGTQATEARNGAESILRQVESVKTR